MSALGDRIRAARKRQGLSQSQLALKVGVKQSSVSDIESGRVTPRDSTLLAISRVLGDDFGERWIHIRLKDTGDDRKAWDVILSPVLAHIRRSEIWLYLFVWRLGQQNETFRSMLRDGVYDAIEEAVRDHVDTPVGGEVGTMVPVTSRDVMLAPHLGTVGGGEEEEEPRRRKTG